MKKTFFLTFVLASGFIFTSCKKDKETVVVRPELEAQTQTQVDDNNQLKAEDDAITDELKNSLENIKGFSGGRLAADSSICGCSVDKSNLFSQKELAFNFDGTTLCGSPRRIRSGVIKVKLVEGRKWKDSAAVMGIWFIDFKVKRFEPNRTWTLNGYKTVENILGTGSNRWDNFSSGNAVFQYKERAKDIKISFLPDAATTPFQMTYSLARISEVSTKEKAGLRRIFFKIDGDTAFGGIDKVDSWGISRNGTTFTNNFLSPWISDGYCGFGQPNSGQFVHKTGGNTVSILLGVNQSGDQNTATCAYGYKINWTTSGGVQGNKVIIY